MGYSSLKYLYRLKCLPIDLIKIDKSFIQELPEDGAMVRIVRTISDMLNLPIMAEGIESAAQRDCLRRHGIHSEQGFFVCAPVAA